MKCPRCQTRMVAETFYSKEGSFDGFRCLACGEVIDEVILQNRDTTKTFKNVRHSDKFFRHELVAWKEA